MSHCIAVIGLGYVGLPLAVECAKKYKTIGFDINKTRINELQKGHDKTLEVSGEELSASSLIFANELNAIKDATIYIVTVPTPIDRHKRPDLTPLLAASTTVGKVLKKGDIVIYESTVYPGATEEQCVPILEQESGFVFNKDFYCGYSPERINPGDKVHTVSKIIKVTSGSTPEAARKVDELYKSIISAGTHLAPCIKVAEAAKVIENSQRDVNIAFINELAKIFNLLDIDTNAVLEAAGTKWNFLKFRPGLVGGHCIGVDPYYLTYKAQELGYHPEIILAGRRLNDNMGQYVSSQLVKLMIKKGHAIANSKVLMLGITFKENCPDIRNSRAIDIVTELHDYGCRVDVYDPWADKQEVMDEFGLALQESIDHEYDAIVLAVAHNEFFDLDLKRNAHNSTVIYDVKNILSKDLVDGCL